MSVVPSSNSSPFRFPRVGDIDASSFNDDNIYKHTLELHEPLKDRGGLKPRQKKRVYAFDQVFSPHHNQEDIWQATEPIIQSAVDGYNV